jgi:hypothetical protein
MEATGTAMMVIENQKISASVYSAGLQMSDLQTRLQHHQHQPRRINQTRQRHYALKMVHVMATLVH